MISSHEAIQIPKRCGRKKLREQIKSMSKFQVWNCSVSSLDIVSESDELISLLLNLLLRVFNQFCNSSLVKETKIQYEGIFKK
jgi:hypothetical protein